MEKADTRPIDFQNIESLTELKYNDGDIAFLSDIREFPRQNFPISLNMLMFVFCEEGELQLEINSINHIFSAKTLFVIKPHESVDNCRISPDFRCGIMCLSHRVMMDSFSDSDFWDCGINFINGRSIPLDEGDIRVYNLYGKLLKAKMEQTKPLFRKEILHSLVRAVIYELLSNVEPKGNEFGRGLVKQSEVLFQRFICLLSSLRVKPRSVAWYAEQLCVSSKHLASVCKQTSGRTAYGWINEYLRIDIDALLRNSNKSIKEIAHYLKFPTISFFCKYVKAYAGLSPTEYRKQLREHGYDRVAD